MSGESLLDMDYFLNEDKTDDDLSEKGFYIFQTMPDRPIVLISTLSYKYTHICSYSFSKIAISYKGIKSFLNSSE